jgi:hypothetical protein
MRTFHFYIDDRRSGSPRELQVQARDEQRARQLAERMLAESEHHLGVEVCEQGVRRFGLGSFATRTWCELERNRPSNAA